MFTATLIAPGLSEQQVDDAWRALDPAMGAQPKWHWLEEGVAADLPLSHLHRPNLLAGEALRQLLPDADIVIQSAGNREKRLLVADMDSTMIQCECIDELADFAGLKAEVAAITEAAMRGELDFAAALDARVALLKELDAGVIDRCLDERVRLTPGAATLVRTMRARGARTVLVSGGFTRFAEPVGRAIGFDRVVANELLIEGGRLTGAVRKPIVGADTKLATLRAEAAALGIDLADTLAVGDGANDLPMIRAAGLGVAYRAKPVVAAAAGARIEGGDLTALLWAQGIPRREWVVEEAA